jgi:hypothetical protein
MTRCLAACPRVSSADANGSSHPARLGAYPPVTISPALARSA